MELDTLHGTVNELVTDDWQTGEEFDRTASNIRSLAARITEFLLADDASKPAIREKLDEHRSDHRRRPSRSSRARHGLGRGQGAACEKVPHARRRTTRSRARTRSCSWRRTRRRAREAARDLPRRDCGRCVESALEPMRRRWSRLHSRRTSTALTAREARVRTQRARNTILGDHGARRWCSASCWRILPGARHRAPAAATPCDVADADHATAGSTMSSTPAARTKPASCSARSTACRARCARATKRTRTIVARSRPSAARRRSSNSTWTARCARSTTISRA